MKKRAGYSLVELLLTVVFVMLGTQMIQAGFLKAADLFGRYQNTLNAMLWADGRLAQDREALLRNELDASARGELETPGKSFAWSREAELGSGPNLHTLRVSLSWTESGRAQTFQKEIYVYKKDLSQGV